MYKYSNSNIQQSKHKKLFKIYFKYLYILQFSILINVCRLQTLNDSYDVKKNYSLQRCILE